MEQMTLLPNLEARLRTEMRDKPGSSFIQRLWFGPGEVRTSRKGTGFRVSQVSLEHL